MKTALVILMAAVLVGMTACTGKETSKEDEGKAGAAAGPNAAVEPAHFGAARLVCSEEIRVTDEGKPVPEGRQWDAPPDKANYYYEFTFYGPKLVKVAGRYPGGGEMWIEKWGVRCEWTYAAHGGVLEQRWYSEDGQAGPWSVCRYDESNKLVEKTEHYGDTVNSRRLYRYDSSGRLIEVTLYQGAQQENKDRTSTFTYSADATQRTERQETYLDDGTTLHSAVTREQRWDPGNETWKTTKENWD